MPFRKAAAAVFAILACAAAAVYCGRARGQAGTAYQQSSGANGGMNRNLIVLDPAHGGADAGATLGDGVLEKDVTLAVAGKLKAALTAAGFTVVTTRDADLSDPLTTDQRAEIANRPHALACLVLHATNTGAGIHIYTSALPPAETVDEAAGVTEQYTPVPWETAQAGSMNQSLQLASAAKAAFAAKSLPAQVGKASVRPLDNLMCPALAIELAPLAVAGSDNTPVNDAGYQQRVAASVTEALKLWRAQVDPSAQATTENANPVEPDAQARAAAKALAAANAAGSATMRANPATRPLPAAALSNSVASTVHKESP